MADQTRKSIIEDLRCVVQEKERELTDLDLMLADYHSERIRLICELRKLRAQLREAEEAVPPVAKP